ncbi:MAG: glycosyltransferase family 39 protein, partial [Oscillospiraceae bacterium]|nr:glycosyltransferase family 39 protein [Oscillospiraceae bacterium]
MEKRFKFSKYCYILAAILITGFAVRLLFIGQFPTGLNQDEASSGYEAYAVMNYGIDRNGVENPVHLISWGSGQNMAYSWLAMPFLKIFGNSVAALRLPMAIAGCISVAVFWLLMKELSDEKRALWATLFFAIYPWHIMKSRWALESNLFPELVLWGCLCLLYYINRQKPVYLYASVLILAFSLYSYGTAYMFMPFFVGGIWIYMAVKKLIAPKHFALSAMLFFIVALPVILFVIINITDAAQIKILGLTIPKLYQQRFTTVTGTGENFLQGCITNLQSLWNILLNQGDGLPWNSMEKYGICYMVFIPLIPVGIAASIYEKRKHSFLMHWWFICALMVTAVTDVNVNRVNIVFI